MSDQQFEPVARIDKDKKRGQAELPPDFMDIELRHSRLFKLHRTDVVEGLMQPLTILEQLDELKQEKGTGYLTERPHRSRVLQCNSAKPRPRAAEQALPH